MVNKLIWAVTISYPFLIWFFLDYVQPRYLALMLAGLFLLRFLYHKPSQSDNGNWHLLFPVIGLFLLLVALVNKTSWLLIYPAVISLAFFCVFAASLVYPPPIVERLARLEDPDLPLKGVRYTRKVTQVWCGFFLLNIALSLLTVWYEDHKFWSLYNGCVFYLLMGLLMAAEMMVRRKVKASY